MVAHPAQCGADASHARRDICSMLHLLVPPACLVCRAPGATLCRACRSALPSLPPGRLHRTAIDVAGGAPARALLVDDVQTTGATLEACARALKQAGSETVVAVTYARTLG